MSELHSRPAVAWPPLAGLVAAKLAVHAWSAGVAAWGYMTDELYFLDSDDKAVFMCRNARRPLRELWPGMTEYR